MVFEAFTIGNVEHRPRYLLDHAASVANHIELLPRPANAAIVANDAVISPEAALSRDERLHQRLSYGTAIVGVHATHERLRIGRARFRKIEEPAHLFGREEFARDGVVHPATELRQPLRL